MELKRLVLWHRILPSRVIVLLFMLVIGSCLHAQQIARGFVVDEDGVPLIGANIMIKDSYTGTITDENGGFTLQVPGSDAVLVISYIGYAPTEVLVGSDFYVECSLKPDMTDLEEVMVVGYGSQNKVSVTGSITTVKSEELLKTPVANISNTLAGRVSGLIAVQRSGEPGKDQSTLKIRGIGTLYEGSQSDPLILVDGVERGFNELDPNEIESVNILKDASATAVFGVRGANGVILVTTRTGQVGRPKVSYSSNVALQNPTRLPRSVNSYEYAQMINEAINNDNPLTEPMFSEEDITLFRSGEDPIGHPDINWYEEIVKPISLQQQHNLNISGGSNVARYFVSLGYFEQDGAYRQADLIKEINGNPNYRRYNFRSNLDFDVNENLSIAIKLGSQVVQARYPGVSAQTIFTNVLSGAPMATLGIVDGKLIKEIEGGWRRVSENPFYDMVGNGYIKNYRNQLNSNLQIRQKLDFITKGLVARVLVSFDGYYDHNIRFIKSVEEYKLVKNIYTEDPQELEKNPYLFILQREEGPIRSSESFGKDRKTYGEAALEYNRTFDSHTVTGLVLGNFQRRYWPKLEYGLPNTYLGLVSRITYDFRHKYLAEFNLGYNGSENFPEGQRFGFFPAFSAGWIISEEQFFPDNGWVTFLKLRGSYGEVGNDKGTSLERDRYMYLPSVYTISGNYYWSEDIGIGPTAASNYVESKIGSPNVTWERARKINVGIETNLLHGKLSLTTDFFQETRENILWKREDIPIIVQAALQPQNIGKVENKGFEVELNFRDRLGQFEYYVIGNYSFARNKILYKSEPEKPFPGLMETGNPVGQYKGLIAEGFYNSWDEINDPDRPISAWEGAGLQPGDMIYRDITGDGYIDDNDMTNIGYSNFPEIMYGLTLGIRWKGLECSVMLQGAENVSNYFVNQAAWPFFSGFRTAFQWHTERWNEERYLNGEAISFPRLSSNPSASDHNYRISSFWLEDASYLRIKNVELAYRFGNARFKSLGINSIRVYINGQNLHTWTAMRYFDPESPGGGQGFYPLMRVFNVGLSVTF